MLLYKTVFASTFGRGSAKPFQTSLIRIGLLAGISLALGFGLATQLPPLPTVPTSKWVVLFIGILVVQITILVSQLTARGITGQKQAAILARLLITLPISVNRHWLALLVPGFTIGSLALLLVSPLLISILTQLGLSVTGVIACVVLGCAAALGLAQSLTRYPIPLQLLVCGAIVWWEFWLIKQLPDSTYQWPILSLLGSLVTSGIWLCWHSRKYSIRAAAITMPAPYIRTAWLPTGLWFYKKLLRASVTQSGFWVALGLSASITYVAMRLQIQDSSLLLAAGSLIAASFAADSRSITKRIHPPEIVALRATLRFTTRHIVSTASIALVAICPIIIWSLPHSDMADYLAIVLGLVAGLFTSFLIAPREGDITAQSGATLLALGILLLPFLPALDTLPAHIIWGAKIVTVAVLILLTFWIEYHRNTFDWRKHA